MEKSQVVFDAFFKADFSAAQRRRMAEQDVAMPDGSFPIRNRGDLQNAIQSFGRAKNPAAAKAHIKRRARALGLDDMIPEMWKFDMPMEMPETESEGPDPEDIHPGTNKRQQMLYEALEELVDEFGKFDQSMGNDGAHYVAESPFPGVVCKNCIFFEGANMCEIVEGEVLPEAVCKFWVIPENLLPAESEGQTA